MLVRTIYFRVFEPVLAFGAEARRDTTRALRAARIGMFPEWFLTLSYFVAAASAAAALLVAAAAFARFGEGSAALGALMSVGIAVGTFLLVRLGFLVYPRVVAASRARRIDAEFPSVVMLSYALSRGGMHALDIFRVVAEERETYGEISTEFALVVRDVDWFGLDAVTALENAATTTPSGTLKGFLEGLVTIMSSGAKPRDFFRRQVETQLAEAEARLEREIDSAGLLAEVYVSGLLVLPLLLMVIMSVLSGIGGGGAGVLPAVVFGLIPVGTVAYLVLVETLMPPDSVGVPEFSPLPLRDFGMASVSAGALASPPAGPPGAEADEEEAPSSRGLRRRLAVERARRRLARRWDAFVKRALERPIDAVDVSGVVALVAVVGGGAAYWLSGARDQDLVVGATGLVFVGAAVAAVPVNAFHEMRIRRALAVEKAIPSMLSKLSGFNERGITLLRSFEILGRTSSGPLAREIRTLERDVAWNGHLGHALKRLRERVNTLRMTKLGVLFERASAATGNLREVLEIAAEDASKTEALRSRKRQSMMTYVVVIYIVYAVFLYVVFMVASLFYGDAGFASALSTSRPSGGAAGASADATRVLFFQAALIQGVCAGLVAGKLGEGHVLSGVKHSAILGAVAWLVFEAGVFA